VRAQQLDRDTLELNDAAVLDIGVQDTGPDGAGWALSNRGVDVPHRSGGELVKVWTIRGAPHVYLRDSLRSVAAAVEPFSDADAGKRIFDAAKPLKAAGISNFEALDAVAAAMRSVVTRPMGKGEVSTALTALMDPPYLRFCRPCNTTHLYEMPFRLAALRAGLELEAGTSPPVLRRVPGFERAARTPEQYDVVRACLRLLGPATPKLVAEYLDARVKDVTARWPDDVVDDPARAKAFWPILGRPGAVLIDGEIAGWWRPRKLGKHFRVHIQLWDTIAASTRGAISEQAERLAAYRQVPLAGIDLDGGPT
jgi:hypothetical protein